MAATKGFVPGADSKIVFDKFHVVRIASEAVDQSRRRGHKALQAGGDERLKETRIYG